MPELAAIQNLSLIHISPQEVSELLTRIAVAGKTEVNKVYDPACGSGSLLLKAAKILGKENVRQGFYGQEINLTTYNLCRINMFLHDIDFDKFDIAHEDTLLNPQHWDDEPFEVIVSNPPYSIKWEGDDNPVLINDPRFSPAGVLAPKSKADLAFIMHSLASVSYTHLDVYKRQERWRICFHRKRFLAWKRRQRF